MLKNLLNKIGIPTTPAGYILHHVEVAHMIEGRLRVVCRELRHNDELYAQVNAELKALSEVSAFSINRDTGSVVINYDPKLIVKESFLDELLTGAKLKYERSKHQHVR